MNKVNYYVMQGGDCMETNLIMEGFKFMVLGMTTVYLFLMLMILVMKIVSKVVNRYFPQKKLSPISIEKVNLSNSEQSNDGAIVAAITASIQEFRKQKK